MPDTIESSTDVKKYCSEFFRFVEGFVYLMGNRKELFDNGITSPASRLFVSDEIVVKYVAI